MNNITLMLINRGLIHSYLRIMNSKRQEDILLKTSVPLDSLFLFNLANRKWIWPHSHIDEQSEKGNQFGIKAKQNKQAGEKTTNTQGVKPIIGWICWLCQVHSGSWVPACVTRKMMLNLILQTADILITNHKIWRCPVFNHLSNAWRATKEEMEH